MQQMTNHRPLAELDLLDDFLFNALLAYPEYGRKFCRKFLKILFGREFKNLNIVTQKSYGGRDTGLHGARLDVYIEEGDEVEIDSSNVSTIYDIESLSQLLDYMENTTRENAVTEELEDIQEMVDVVKEDAEVTVAYMKGFERDQMFLEEGKELGRKLEQENTLREKNRADTEKNRADTEKNRADTEKNRADAEKNRAEEEKRRADAAVEEIEKLRRQLEELQKQ